ncbi:MAG: hydrolase [Spirochaetaceae bacterium]|nr:hydrolase [Spirochaetaceae bacterium]|tara:strand:- start:12104 stop:13702 length:1599 start_codon:yes stop_codon:yes gene_type:complete
MSLNVPDNNETSSEPEITEDDLSHKLTLRTLRIDDYDDVQEIMNLVYNRMGGAWSREEISVLLNRFPEGQICIEDKGKVVGCALCLIVNYARFGDNHTYDEITGYNRMDTHDPSADTLYGIDLFVHPEYRGLRLGRRLYDARKLLCEEKNLRRIITGGRIPGYNKHADDMTVQEYINRVRNGEIYDPVLSFQLANDFHVRKVLRRYIPEDEDSRSYATLLEWINIYYENREGKRDSYLSSRKSVVRVGAVQWQMRRFHSMDDVIEQMEYFVDAIAGYNSDFVLFPEFFNGPLLANSPENHPSKAIRHLATYTDDMAAAVRDLAVAYNINIVAGSMPWLDEEGGIKNVSYICRRDGTMESQAKIHITPDEKAYWGLHGGDTLSVFETDIGKVGVLICYDVEFPELSRVLAEQGMKILFVPFWTDTRNAYLRVRRCAQARAIENECYVVITGSVGNLPRVENMDIQYSQAAMFSPSDFSFPHDAIIAEATPNTEMTLVSDLDMDLLKELRYQGSVQNFRDRRLDLYRIDWLKHE